MRQLAATDFQSDFHLVIMPTIPTIRLASSKKTVSNAENAIPQGSSSREPGDTLDVNENLRPLKKEASSSSLRSAGRQGLTQLNHFLKSKPLKKETSSSSLRSFNEPTFTHLDNLIDSRSKIRAKRKKAQSDALRTLKKSNEMSCAQLRRMVYINFSYHNIDLINPKALMPEYLSIPHEYDKQTILVKKNTLKKLIDNIENRIKDIYSDITIYDLDELKTAPTPKEMIRILENTILSIEITPNTKPYEFIKKSINSLQNIKDNVLDKVYVDNIVTSSHEVIKKHEDVIPDTKRMPTECMIHWIAAVNHELKKTPQIDEHYMAAKHQYLNALLDQAIKQWETRRTTFSQTIDFFESMRDFDHKSEAQKHEIRHLPKLARQFLDCIPEKEDWNFNVNKDEIKFKTRLQDNLYGRVYATHLVNEMMIEPRTAVKHTMYNVGCALMELIPKPQISFDGIYLKSAIDHVFEGLLEDQRSWKNDYLNKFFTCSDSLERWEKLKDLLTAKKESGIDCIVIPYVAVKIFIALQKTEPTSVPWKYAADSFYGKKIKPLNRRVDRMDVIRKNLAILRNNINSIGDNKKEIRKLRKLAAQVGLAYMQHISYSAGITRLYQPNVFELRAGSVKPVNRYGPDFWMPEDYRIEELPTPKNSKDFKINRKKGNEKFTDAERQFLEHGMASEAGVSGTTSLILFFCAWRNAAKPFPAAYIDPKSLLEALVMFTVYDGGHTPDECLAAAKVIEKESAVNAPLGLNLGNHEDDQSNFYITSLENLFAYSDFEGNSYSMRFKSRQALINTAEYFCKYSRFAGELAQSKVVPAQDDAPLNSPSSHELPTADDASGFVSKRNVDLTAKNIEELNREAIFPFRHGQKIRRSSLLSEQQEAALVKQLLKNPDYIDADPFTKSLHEQLVKNEKHQGILIKGENEWSFRESRDIKNLTKFLSTKTKDNWEESCTARLGGLARDIGAGIVPKENQPQAMKMLTDNLEYADKPDQVVALEYLSQGFCEKSRFGKKPVLQSSDAQAATIALIRERFPNLIVEEDCQPQASLILRRLACLGANPQIHSNVHQAIVDFVIEHIFDIELDWQELLCTIMHLEDIHANATIADQPNLTRFLQVFTVLLASKEEMKRAADYVETMET